MAMGELAGHEVPIVWEGRRAKAFVPDPLAVRDLGLDPPAVAAAAAAAADVITAAGSLEPRYEPMARLLLRAEGVASSTIEGIRAPLADIVVAAMLPESTSPAAWVAANLAVLTEALAHADDRDLTLEDLCGWHRTLMTGSPLPQRYVGVLRDEQGWIGGTDPTNAALVTPPPDALDDLVDDVVAYVNRTDLDPVAQAAIAHAQFEVVHPFADGNGRLGRVLVSWILARRLSLLVPPPVSVAIAADVGGYLAGLALYRYSDHNAWVRWFAGAVRSGGTAQRRLATEVAALVERWARQMRAAGIRQDSSIWKVIELVPLHLVLTATDVGRQLGISSKAAGQALHRLEVLGILASHGTLPSHGGRPRAVFVSPDLLALAGSSPLR